MKFSIIIPIYNVEKYLNKCIKSVLEQTYKNIEIILVDDGSTDNSGQICDNWSKKESSIKVIHKINGGLSDARNEGIKNATGNYLLFLDSDDYWCERNFLQEINNILKKEKHDLIIIGAKKYYEKTNQFYDNVKNKCNKSEIEELISKNVYKACAWDKIIKKDIITKNKIFFPKGRLSEDIEWCAKILKHIDLTKVYYFSKNVYVYRQRENSISTKVNDKFLLDIYEMIDSQKVICKKQNEIIINSYLAYEYSVLLGWTSLKCYNPKLKKKIYNLKYLLKYKLSNKVKFVNFMVNIFGIKFTSYILGKFIDIKNKRGK